MSTIQQHPRFFRQWWFVAAAVVAGVVLAMVVTSLRVALTPRAPDQVIKVGRPGGLPEIGTEHLHGSGSMDACLTHQHPTAASC